MSRLKRYLLAGLCVVFALQPVYASADSFDVTASIPYEVPIQAAVIDPSLDGATNASDVIEVFGTCQGASPPNIVSIWRGDDLLGSVNCELNNTFRLLITLDLGENQIIARTSNLSNIYGPNSTPVTIVYEPPAEDRPPNTTPALRVTSPTPFTLLNDENDTEIEVVISGGFRPYVLLINWGDGTTESLQLGGPGTFPFKHTYVERGVYKVVATVTDDRGVTKSIQLIVSSTSLPGEEGEDEVVVEEDEGDKGVRFYVGIGVVVFIILFLIIFLSSFFLGRWYEYEKLKKRLTDRPKKKRAKKKARKTKRRKK